MVGRKTYDRGSYKNWFGHAPTPLYFSGLRERISEYMPMDLAHKHVHLGLAREQMSKSLAHEQMPTP